MMQASATSLNVKLRAFSTCFCSWYCFRSSIGSLPPITRRLLSTASFRASDRLRKSKEPSPISRRFLVIGLVYRKSQGLVPYLETCRYKPFAQEWFPTSSITSTLLAEFKVTIRNYTHRSSHHKVVDFNEYY